MLCTRFFGVDPTRPVREPAACRPGPQQQWTATLQLRPAPQKPLCAFIQQLIQRVCPEGPQIEGISKSFW